MVKTARSSAKFVAFHGNPGSGSPGALPAGIPAAPPFPGCPPGAKLGLSNIVSMYAVGNLGLGPAMAIALTKGLFAFLTRGGDGGADEHRRKPFEHPGAVAVPAEAGVWAHRLQRGGGHWPTTGAQLAVACVLTSEAVLFYVPFLALLGAATGALTGLAPGHPPAAVKPDRIPTLRIPFPLFTIEI